MKNKKAGLGSTIFYTLLTIVLIYGLSRLEVLDNIINMVEGWFLK
jgi:hypothetical protein